LELKAVVFDLDDTLYQSTRFNLFARKQAVEAMILRGLNVPSSKALKMLDEIYKEFGSNFESHYDVLVERLGFKKDYRLLSAGVSAHHAAKNLLYYFISPGCFDLLLFLKEKHVKIFLLTGGVSVKQWDKLNLLGITDFFDNVFVVNDKHDGRQFKDFIKFYDSLGFERSDCFMVGDRDDVDIIPMKKLGFKTIRVLQGKYSNIKKSKADFVAKNIFEVKKILERDVNENF
jgi:putative hydrolase of the HAD superfamily